MFPVFRSKLLDEAFDNVFTERQKIVYQAAGVILIFELVFIEARLL